MIATQGASTTEQAPVVENVVMIDSEMLCRMVDKGRKKSDRRYKVIATV